MLLMPPQHGMNPLIMVTRDGGWAIAFDTCLGVYRDHLGGLNAIAVGKVDG